MIFVYVKRVRKRYDNFNSVILITFEISNDCKCIVFDCGDYWRWSNLNKISMYKGSEKVDYHIISKKMAKRFFNLRCVCKLISNYNSYASGKVGVIYFLDYTKRIIEDGESGYAKFIIGEF